MYRFLVLYSSYKDDYHQHYAEGLVMYDGAIYVRGFAASDGGLFPNMHAMRCAMRDNDDLRFHRIQMIDQPAKDEY